MHENLVFRGKTEEEQAGTEALLKKQREEGSKPIENELEKTEEDLKMIEKINEILTEEFARLNLPPPPKIDPDRIHFFEHKDFHEKNENSIHTHAFYNPQTQQIQADVSKFTNTLTKFSYLLHECIHKASFQKFRTVIPEEGEARAVPYRIGYEINDRKWSFQEAGLKRFNEGLVDAITHSLLTEWANPLAREFGIDPNDIPDFQEMNYGYYSNIIGLITKGLASTKSITTDKAWDTIIRGEFSGEMMHLRDIEKAFGKEALRVLAAIDNPDKESRQEAKVKISKFFACQDPIEREKLKEEIFSIEDSNQRTFHKKRNEGKKKRLVKNEVEILSKKTEKDGSPSFNGWEEAAVILSQNNKWLNPNGTEAIGSSEGGLDCPGTVPWIDLAIRHELEKYMDEGELFNKLSPKYKFTKEDKEYLANNGSHPIWEEMTKITKNKTRVDEFRYEFGSFQRECSNLESILGRFYSNIPVPENPAEQLIVDIGRKGHAWRIRNGSDEDYNADIKNMSLKEKSELEKRITGYKNEMKAFEKYLKEWNLMVN